MAIENESTSVSRKRLIQSENSFRKALNMAPKDPFCYQGLARLYLSWAEKSEDQSEITDYISKAEDVINEGLKKVVLRDKLWIESAKIQEFLGDHPGYLRNLERAVSETPGSIIARYILGRAYRFEKEYEKAVKVLKPIITDYPDQFRSYVEYALSLHHSGGSYEECIATLRLSALYGYGDPRFIAVLGGLCFLNKNYAAAERVFDKSVKRDFTVTETNRIQFRPVDISLQTPYIVNGKVISVRAGYAFIESDDFPKPIICPGSKFRGILMNKGLKVRHELAFTPNGPVADNIMTI